ncbi:MAG: hypothetical protein QMD09_14190, partial [Desulfatibacillaceae bacterium]|nr:hypothetical protein [Desulfatibacillaceae bacterium]
QFPRYSQLKNEPAKQPDPALATETQKRRLRLAKMVFCLDGRPCRELQSLGGYDSPRCMMCGQSPFELQACPEGRWMFYADAQNIRSCLK